MARRSAVVLVPLLLLLLAALGVPLAVTTATRQTQEVYLDRLADGSRFAALTGEVLQTGQREPLASELQRYEQVYGITATALGPGGAVLAGSPPPALGPEPQGRLDLDLATALGGSRPGAPPTVWPWSEEPLVVVEPVTGEGQQAAVVLVSPTPALVADLRRTWAAWGALGLVVAGAAALAVPPLTRWQARPLRELDAAAAQVAAGDARVRVDARRGPPEVRRLAESFNRMVAVVETTLRHQRAFVADASHQLRNPLASLRLSVDNLLPHLRSDDARADHAEAVQDAEAMGRLLESLLAATRLGGLQAGAPTPLGGPDGLLATRRDAWRARAPAAAGVVVEVAVPSEPLPVPAHPDALGAVVDELVDNARRLSGGTRVRVSAEREGAPDRVVLRVVDDGRGLPPEQRERAAQRFWRAPEHQNVPGTGLGLAIAAEVAEGCGGSLALHDAPGGGLDVRLVLPLAPAALRPSRP
ncbi:sensor histidine kinase KdpD [Quadrisphaera sp. DSM 44207]|uniref:sensor histidine kinase n=1 Tax=Quadrisphaera sp. DSM 44207 TaxID=1881057 RepID=UPI00087FA14D|nr:HAMP domain-containing sensor histidine kinase [Quadrisphaera sp. DSM 44207]SDQ36313.1 Signal transduction histidine kinase [Quadrisphaera sp. DSM 44207]